MRGLAEYAMSGRLQAATVAILFGLIPGFGLISGAVVALVILRRGLQDGLQILLWASLPALLQWQQLGDPGSLMMLLGVALAGGLLRISRSWQLTSLLIMASGVLQQLSLPWQKAYLARMHNVVNSLQSHGFALQDKIDGKVVTVTPQQLLDMMLKYYGASQMLLMLGCLLLGRYWQASLYNPGGFRQEFHNLRFDWRLMVVLLGLVGAALIGKPPFSDWLLIVCMPPILEALAVIHKVVARRNLGYTWLVLTYLLLMIVAPALALLGFADCLIDFRKRFAADTDNQDAG